MPQPDPLRLMLDGPSPNDRCSELFDNSLVNSIALCSRQREFEDAWVSRALTKSSTVHRPARNTTGAV